ncbi:uncharacterized protein LOC122857214 isoform X1 [Aphidius gifuensis]|uniref:uncharacterized protein LOC122857214 isoform X1 n=2 Tax=Aphidius gifuensis TaxID=684658 RepID=UPI001CDBF65A|nr:uncharacterized protein LOC122857214 isoform X1 [Aphidius gifuensis]
MSSINVSDSTPSFEVDENSGFSKHVKAFSKKMEKFEADHEERLMALLSSADSLRQVKQLLSDEGELSEGMKEVFDKAIKEEEEEKKASEVPIKRIINKIRIMNKRERQHELDKLLKKNEAELQRTEHYLFITLTPSQIKERQAQLDLEQDLLAEYLWILKEISPNTHENAVKLQSAESWPDYPEFEDTSSEDLFQKLCEEYLKMKNSHIDACGQQPIF